MEIARAQPLTFPVKHGELLRHFHSCLRASLQKTDLVCSIDNVHKTYIAGPKSAQIVPHDPKTQICKSLLFHHLH
jgi:hypothetical protein